jgi:hypothetical protein
VPTSAQADYDRNLRDVDTLLTRTHDLPLSQADLEGIANVYSAFYWYGPIINYNSSRGRGFGRGRSMATYAQLMIAADAQGVARSFLASEDTFRYVKDIEERNLVIPVVGDFGGRRALRAIGQWVREHGAVVSAFYLSNVEQYLQQDGTWGAFCANVASMPLDARSTFIRSQSFGGGGFQNMLGGMQAETSGCVAGPRGVR